MASTVTLHLGDIRDIMPTLPDNYADLLVTSTPFLALRSYLPADHPDKAKEIGSEPTPAAFLERCPTEAELVYRRDIKIHHCGSAKAKDANITQALIDRFAPGAPNRGKGTTKAPGWFHGFRADIWQAYALAVYVADISTGGYADGE